MIGTESGKFSKSHKQNSCHVIDYVSLQKNSVYIPNYIYINIIV